MENYEPVSPQPATVIVEDEERFAECLKRIRLGLNSKQAWLSQAIGCTDAAISLWETGSRIPTPQSLGRLLAALAREGTPTSELLKLRRVWLNDQRRRATRRG
jgi:transcriptional regulator with XRE-family HTH domain